MARIKDWKVEDLTEVIPAWQAHDSAVVIFIIIQYIFIFIVRFKIYF